MSTPTPRPQMGGFASRAAVEAGRDIEAKRAAVEASLPLEELRRPTESEQQAGAAFVFTHKDTAGWQVTGTVTRGPNGLLISRLEVVAAPLSDAPHGVTTRILQKLPVERILASIRARAALEEAQREGTRKILGEEPAAGFFTPGDAEPESAGRKNAVTDDLLRQVAVAYLAETAAGKPPGALKRMAERFGRPEKTIQGWISRARKAGWLGPGARGRTGAEMGPKLRSWVGQTAREHEPVYQEAVRIGQALGLEKAGQLFDALDAYDDEAGRALANRIGLHPLAACVVAEKLWGHSLTAELAQRGERAPHAAEDALLDEIGREAREPFAGLGLTVTLDEP